MTGIGIDREDAGDDLAGPGIAVTGPGIDPVAAWRAALAECRALLGWTGEPGDAGTDPANAAGAWRLARRIDVDGQPCDAVIEADPEARTITVRVAAPFRVPQARRVQACVLANAINLVSRVGRMEVDMGDGELRAFASAHCEGIDPAGRFFATMLRACAGMLRYWMGALAAVAFTHRPAADILDEERQREEIARANAELEARFQRGETA